MVDIDYIMQLLDCNNSSGEQVKGIALARGIQCINVFLRPNDNRNNKNVWANCAKILSEKTDDELSCYLPSLMEWLQDLNWPGALCIVERLNRQSNDSWYHSVFDSSLRLAKALGNKTWANNLMLVKKTTPNK